MEGQRSPEQELNQMFGSEEAEFAKLQTLLPKIEAERAALGEIDSVQLTDLDLERMAELDENIREFKARLEQLSPKVEAKHNQEHNIQDISNDFKN